MSAEVVIVLAHALATLVALGLAALILTLRFADTLNQAFAVFLVARAWVSASAALSTVTAGTEAADLWYRLGFYGAIALLPTLGIALALHGRRTQRRVRGWFVPALLALLVVAEIAYARDHCVVACVSGDARSSLGALSLLAYGAPFAYGLAAIAFVGQARRQDGPLRDGALLLASGFLLSATFSGTLGIVRLGRLGLGRLVTAYDPGLWPPVVMWISALALVPALLAAFLALRLLSTDASQQHKRRALAWGVGLAMLSGVVAGSGAADAGGWVVLLLGIWNAVVPILAAYALARYRLFGLDLKVRTGVQRAVVASVPLLTFFIVTQLVQNLFNETFGLVAGGVTAGVCLFALSPLQAWAERVGRGFFPHAKPIPELSDDERRDLYRAQVSLAWSDGVLNLRERKMLNDLRERLGLDAEEAFRLENAAASAGIPHNALQP